MEKRSVWYSIQQWRRERTLAHEMGEDVPLPPQIEEGGLVLPFATNPETFRALYPEAEGQELEIYMHPDWEVKDGKR
jgi:hypothetical protein